MEIFVLIDNQQAGPYSKDEIKRMLEEGSITLGHLVWFESMESWVPMASIPTLYSLLYPPNISHAESSKDSHFGNFKNNSSQKDRESRFQNYILESANKTAKFGPFSSYRHQWLTYCISILLACIFFPLAIAGKVLTFIQLNPSYRALSLDPFSKALNDYIAYTSVSIYSNIGDVEALTFTLGFVCLSIIPACLLYMILLQLILWPIYFLLKNKPTSNFYTLPGLVFFVIMFIYFRGQYLNINYY